MPSNYNNAVCTEPLLQYRIIFLYVALQIGFLQQSYNFTEPTRRRLFMDVIIQKENNVITEQTYTAVITTSTPTDPHLNAATPEPLGGGGNYDYSLGTAGQYFITREFCPDVQSITFNFFLNGDTFPEGVESFQATITSSEGFPTYRSPTTLFTTTLINIIDDDSKFKTIIFIISINFILIFLIFSCCRWI